MKNIFLTLFVAVAVSVFSVQDLSFADGSPDEFLAGFNEAMNEAEESRSDKVERIINEATEKGLANMKKQDDHIDFMNPPIISAEMTKGIIEAMNMVYRIKSEFIYMLAKEYKTAGNERQAEILNTVSDLGDGETFNKILNDNE